MLTSENAAAFVLNLAIVLYALFGGADFGGGIWTLLASGPRAVQQRSSLFHAIGPVWETNHVWLIFIVVTLFTAFPVGFSALFIALTAPLVLALVGITFRGAAFAFRHFGGDVGKEVPLRARVFEIASIVTAFALGVAVTAAASGRIVLQQGGVQVVPFAWASPFTLVGGLIGMAICAYLAPIYMSVRTSGELLEDFRKRALIAALVLGLLTTVEIPVAMADAPLFAERLLKTWPIIFVILAVACGVSTQLLLWRRRFRPAQVLGAGAVAMTITGFSAALYPDLIIGQLTLAAAAAPPETLRVYLTVLPLGALILVPALVFLYRTFGRETFPG
jgi:cytochrome d ubiquinol oxidase subunit II